MEERLTAQQQTLLWNEEKYLRIAPSEGSIPHSSLSNKHAGELSFPAIYLGQFKVFPDGLHVTPFMLATSDVE